MSIDPKLVAQKVDKLRSMVAELAAAHDSQQDQCGGIPRKGCNYLAQCNHVCNKCGEVHSLHQLQTIISGAQQAAAAKEVQGEESRIVECAKRLVEHADFQLGGCLSADSKSKDIPSKAVSKVKARHLAALRDALATQPQPQENQIAPDLTDEEIWNNDAIMGVNAELGLSMENIGKFARAVLTAQRSKK